LILIRTHADNLHRLELHWTRSSLQCKCCLDSPTSEAPGGGHGQAGYAKRGHEQHTHERQRPLMMSSGLLHKRRVAPLAPQHLSPHLCLDAPGSTQSPREGEHN